MTSVADIEAAARTTSEQGNLYDVIALKKYFPIKQGMLQRVVAFVQAVDDVTFSIGKGETVGLVGESGCGKTTTGRLLLRLIEPTSGRITFNGADLLAMGSRQLKATRAQ